MATATTLPIESHSTSPRLTKSKTLGLVVAAWMLAIVIGMLWLLSYKNAKGDLGSPPQTWPTSASIPAPDHRPTLLIFSHPHCPCTRASFRELERILTRPHKALDTRVIFVGPNGFVSPESVTLASAMQLPTAQVTYDNGGLADLFSVKTSGHVLLYDANGQLRFSGGVTASRGHEGDSIGGSAIATWIQGQSSKALSAPVFGCPLFATDRMPNEKSCEEGACRE